MSTRPYEDPARLLKNIERLKKEIGDLSPKDRLDYVNGIIYCLNATFPSSVATYNFFQDPRQTNSLDADVLKDLFEKIKKACLDRIDVNKEVLSKAATLSTRAQELYR